MDEEFTKRFRIERPDPNLPDITPEFLANLNDLARKFGTPFSDGICMLSTDFPKKISVQVAEDSQNPTTLIVGEGNVASAGSFVISLQGALVLWDKRVSKADLETMIGYADSQARKAGLMDAGGERPALSKLVPRRSPEYAVDEIFSNPGMVMAVLPGGPDAQTLLSMFDRPEELAIITEPLSNSESICRKQDLPLIEKRRRVVMEILSKHGIKILADVAGLSSEDVLALRKKIDEAMS